MEGKQTIAWVRRTAKGWGVWIPDDAFMQELAQKAQEAYAIQKDAVKP